MKSAIRENKGKRVRDWTKFHNGLKVRKGYENIVPLTLKEQKNIKDVRYIKYRILSYEVDQKINGLKSIDVFKDNTVITASPQNIMDLNVNEPREDSVAYARTPPQHKLRDNLPSVTPTKLNPHLKPIKNY